MPISQSQYREMLARLEKDRKPPADIPDEPESLLHDQIEAHCRSQMWLAVHSRMDRATTQAKGVPDFIIFTPKSVFCIECKRKAKKCTPEQLAFAAQVKKLGYPHFVVYTFQEFLDCIAQWNQQPSPAADAASQ